MHYTRITVHDAVHGAQGQHHGPSDGVSRAPLLFRPECAPHKAVKVCHNVSFGGRISQSWLHLVLHRITGHVASRPPKRAGPVVAGPPHVHHVRAFHELTAAMEAGPNNAHGQVPEASCTAKHTSRIPDAPGVLKPSAGNCIQGEHARRGVVLANAKGCDASRHCHTWDPLGSRPSC
jgi:hypothetical protein